MATATENLGIFGYSCGAIIGCIVGAGLGVWGAVEAGNAIIAAMPPSSYIGALILAIFAGFSIGSTAAGIGAAIGGCACGCCCGCLGVCMDVKNAY